MKGEMRRSREMRETRDGWKNDSEARLRSLSKLTTQKTMISYLEFIIIQLWIFIKAVIRIYIYFIVDSGLEVLWAPLPAVIKVFIWLEVYICFESEWG